MENCTGRSVDTGEPCSKDLHNIPGCIKDSKFDIKLIRRFCTLQGFKAIEDVCALKPTQNWVCEIRHEDLSNGQYIGCEMCLNWYHYACQKLKTPQGSNTGIVDLVRLGF